MVSGDHLEENPPVFPYPGGSHDALADRHFEDAIKLYLEIRKTKPLTAADEKELAARIDLGDKAALDLMIVSNLHRVVKIARRYIVSVRKRNVPDLLKILQKVLQFFSYPCYNSCRNCL